MPRYKRSPVKEYTKAAFAWPRGDRLTIESILGTEIAKFPLAFLASCGDNTWSYVLYVVSLLVEQDREHPGSILEQGAEHPVDVHAIPRAGTFRYVELGLNTEVRFTPGPTYYISVVPASGEIEKASTQGTGSSSRESASPKHRFRMTLIARDGVCVVTREPYGACQAAHLVPHTRLDIYEQIQGTTDERFDSAAGVLLETNLHYAYDALQWSLYFKEGVFYVHYFTPDDSRHSLSKRIDLHGKAIPLEKFGDDYNSPDPALAAWHYEQTVRARIRGFAVASPLPIS